jgi:ectoine hydroxylase-related dioxygenase (phytanoyl-CoA dioxygenase family)
VDGIPVDEAVVIDLPAGGCMFHHCQTLHYTGPNTTDRQRRAFSIHYMPVGTRDGNGVVMQVGWSRPQLSSSHQAIQAP